MMLGFKCPLDDQNLITQSTSPDNLQQMRVCWGRWLSTDTRVGTKYTPVFSLGQIEGFCWLTTSIWCHRVPGIVCSAPWSRGCCPWAKRKKIWWRTSKLFYIQTCASSHISVWWMWDAEDSKVITVSAISWGRPFWYWWKQLWYLCCWWRILITSHKMEKDADLWWNMPKLRFISLKPWEKHCCSVGWIRKYCHQH